MIVDKLSKAAGKLAQAGDELHLFDIRLLLFATSLLGHLGGRNRARDTSIQYLATSPSEQARAKFSVFPRLRLVFVDKTGRSEMSLARVYSFSKSTLVD